VRRTAAKSAFVTNLTKVSRRILIWRTFSDKSVHRREAGCSGLRLRLKKVAFWNVSERSLQLPLSTRRPRRLGARNVCMFGSGGIMMMFPFRGVTDEEKDLV
jgi:hypothetical protein